MPRCGDIGSYIYSSASSAATTSSTSSRSSSFGTCPPFAFLAAAAGPDSSTLSSSAESASSSTPSSSSASSSASGSSSSSAGTADVVAPVLRFLAAGATSSRKVSQSFLSLGWELESIEFAQITQTYLGRPRRHPLLLDPPHRLHCLLRRHRRRRLVLRRHFPRICKVDTLATGCFWSLVDIMS